MRLLGSPLLLLWPILATLATAQTTESIANTPTQAADEQIIEDGQQAIQTTNAPVEVDVTSSDIPADNETALALAQCGNCSATQYCGEVTDYAKEHAVFTNTTVPDFVCMDTNYRPGTCSMAYLNCDQFANCTESSDGLSYTCECQVQAVGDGFNNGTGCELLYKICSSNFDCPENGHCNSEFKCECKAGFEGDARYNCTDIIDCPSPMCDPHAICEDTPGNFTCTCDMENGFYGDGQYCIYRCHSDADCHWDAACSGDLQCECKEGYQGNGTYCEDIKECNSTKLNHCSDDAVCIEQEGSYDCECMGGFYGDGEKCTKYPENCWEVFTRGGIKSGAEYTIDPDFKGPANPFVVRCFMSKDKNIYSALSPLAYPLEAKPTTEIGYSPSTEDIKAFVNKHKFCKQEVAITCGPGFSMFPGTTWYDAFGNVHQNWGSTNDNECICGAVGGCHACQCDGTRYSEDVALFFNKTQLPVMKVDFAQSDLTTATIKKVGDLMCAGRQFEIPVDCHEAKMQLDIHHDGPLFIDPDGEGGADPFVAYCDMTSYDHVGITVINPTDDAIEINTREEKIVTYNNNDEQIKALIDGSVFCSQRVEFQCKDSSLMGEDGGYVYGPTQRLDYFPGANGEKGSCGCGTTKSCEQKDVKCNCDIQDGKERKDFGLIINKADLPAVKVTAQYGPGKSSTYKVGGLQCSQKQFGIEPNCEKYRIAMDYTEDHTYLIDPDGPGKLEPFNVECKFEVEPPQGITIVHHNDEEQRVPGDELWILKYLQTTPEQIDALKNRSPATHCSQEVNIGCVKYSLKYEDKAVKWTGQDGEVVDLALSMDTCGLDGLGCKCDGVKDETDSGYLLDKSQVPAKAFNFKETSSQEQYGAELTIAVGPLICSDVFPTCAMLKEFIDSSAAAEGEKAIYNGRFTIDPDGPGKVKPFTVTCQFPATIVELTPGGGELNPEVPDPNNPNNTNSGGSSQCFPVSYSDGEGNPITPEQITALVQSSNDCTQSLELECQNAPATDMVNFTSCDGTTQPGWGGSFGEEKCACGVNGNCDGGIDANCNCDMEDDTPRKDAGNIVATERLPVCEVCLSTPPYPPQDPTQPPPPPKKLKYNLGKLECNGKPGTGGKTCQEARKDTAVNVESMEVGISLNKDNPVPVGCRFRQDPPMGEMIIKPRPPVFPPNKTDDPVDIDIKYININITLLKDPIMENEYCSQNVYMFCGNDKEFNMAGENYWTDFDDNKFYDWEEMKSTHEDLDKICDAHADLCSQCGKPRGFKVGEKERLPMKGVKIAVTGVTMVVGEVACIDLLKSCQHAVELSPSPRRYSGYVGRNDWVIDPDGSGDIKPFKANCHMNWQKQDGVTEVEIKPGNSFRDYRKKWVGGKQEPGEFSLPVEYQGTTVEQIEALTKVSDFCWQSVRYECRQSPLSLNGQQQSYLTLGNGNATGFGTGADPSFPGCACSQTGTCAEEGLQCNCDAMDTDKAVDQGSVTDKDALPITGITVGGQAQDGRVGVQISNVRCSKRPVDPPRDCAEARKWVVRYRLNYRKSGEYLISPDPENNVEPFMVKCDFDSVPGQAITVILPRYPVDVETNGTTSDKTPPKYNITHTPGKQDNTTVEYYSPSKEQIRALVDYSKYCYQAVKFECQSTPLFSEGSHWFTAGDPTKTPRTFWGGGEPRGAGQGYCACGLESNCGGTDSSQGQRSRHCNCDVADGELRADAGIITQKELLPVGDFINGADTTFGSLNMTVGPVVCSDKPIPVNECELGFHDCHELATCVDTEDGYRCLCNPGYQGKGAILSQNSPRANGRECIDDNECSWNPCHYDQTCLNLPGTFNCTCKSGLDQIGDMECLDIDECADPELNDCHEHADCKNTHRSYECRCKSGFRGDGRQSCIPVGQCFCFGDPHCISFDQKWIHHQGECEYVMAQDGCDGVNQTFRISVEHWKEANVRPGYYAYIKAVHIQLFNLGFNVSLKQNHVIEVNGIAMTQFHDAHRFSVSRIINQVKLKTIQGLEMAWDGKDVVEVYVPINSVNQTCGICGNFNQDKDDDWTIGPACPAKEGQVTDNYDLFGKSWTVTDSEAECKPDCTDEKPDPEIKDCNFPMRMVNRECNKLLHLRNSPFAECLKLKSQEDRDQLKYSCLMDGCNEEYDLRARICTIGKSIFQRCASFDNIKIKNWRNRVQACEKPTCDKGFEYKSCGPTNPATCLTDAVALEMVDTGEVCAEGCYCKDGMLQEGDKCVQPEDCGCLYNNEYMAAGEVVVMPNCGDTIECVNRNKTIVTPMNCSENQECGVNATTGKRSCVCIKGYLWDETSQSCIVDLCEGIVCSTVNAVCKNGTCECGDGFRVDCGVCEDIDECAIGEHECSPLNGKECINTEGSYECRCKEGLLPNGDKCDDIDECELSLKACGGNAQCVNLFGGAECECCAGFSKNAQGTCSPDGTPRASRGRCCNCVGHLCQVEGEVCGTDGKSYPDFRTMTVQSCRGDKEVNVSYPGPCQSSCETIVCEKKFSECKEDEEGIPQCSCPTCQNITTMYEEDLVCATNKVTYISICHLQKDNCEAKIETNIDIETIGKPCPEGPPGEPAKPGDWEDWGPCSESCKQGTRTRSRDVKGLNLHVNETKPCYNTCPEGPCTPKSCPTPGSVCTANNVTNDTECSCPQCEQPYDPVCGQVGLYVSTFENECALFKTACESGEEFSLLEDNACEEKPKGCGRVRNFKVYEDEDGCRADREIDMGYCYGGCDEATMDNDMCCTGVEFEYKFAILYCPSTDDKEVVRKNKFIKQIKSCDCINPNDAKEEAVPTPTMPAATAVPVVADDMSMEQPAEETSSSNSVVETLA